LKERPASQSHEEWEESFKRTIRPPKVTLQSYGETHIFTVGQTEVTLKRGPYSLKTTVQIQKNAPVPLLIGTNLQPMLGFMFLQAHTDGSAVDLLNNEAVTLQLRSQPAVVCLVRPVHIPAYHGRLVDVTCDSTLVKDDTLFESAREELA
jgi:hypothetical protein